MDSDELAENKHNLEFENLPGVADLFSRTAATASSSILDNSIASVDSAPAQVVFGLI